MGGKSPTGGKRGRPRGSRNKVTAAREKEIAASGITPLDYMLRVFRDETADTSRRDDMAKAAAPFCHPRLTTMDAKIWAELNANVQNTHVLDIRGMDPSKRAVLRHLLEEAAAEPGVPDGSPDEDER